MSVSTASTRPAGPAASHTDPGPMSHRDVLVAMSGLLLGMFVAILSGTVVSTALPTIIAELGGTQSSYTWVVTASLLATTVSTPIWGKFADLLNRKLLVQISLIVFVLGSALSGFAADAGTLIAFRVVQGLGAGGLTALVQIVMADIVSPRERGKYMGLIGAVMAVATIGGPLLGGVITDALNWRWNFYVALPVAAVAIVVLQKTLRVPQRIPGKVRIDYLGTALLAGGVSLLLIWVSLAGGDFDWISVTSGVMVGAAVLMLAALVLVEFRTPEPIIPMSLFSSRTFTLSAVASISVGVAMFGTTVFLAQYMQLARGATATESGLMTSPMVIGVMAASTIVGALISRRGFWKSYVVTGSVVMTVGLTLMGTISYDTPFVVVAAYMVLLGAGVGMVMQNLVLIVQNDVDPRRIGVASSGVAFFRGLGGAVGVSAMGGLLGNQIATLMAGRRSELAAAVAASGDAGRQAAAHLASGTVPEVASLPPLIARIVQAVYGSGIAEIFLVAAPLGLVTILAVVFLPNKPLGGKTTAQRIATGEGDGEVVAKAGGDQGAAARVNGDQEVVADAGADEEAAARASGDDAAAAARTEACDTVPQPTRVAVPS